MKHDACSIEWTGLFVCDKCRDPRPPYIDPPIIDPREGAPVKNAQLHPDHVFADDDDPVTGNDL